jgi:hypothetical protein
MRSLAVAIGLAAAVLLAGGAWKAEALTWDSVTVNLPGVAKNYSPIEKAGYRHRGWVRLGPLPGLRSAPVLMRALLAG